MTREDLMLALACCVHEDGHGCADCPMVNEPCCEDRLMKMALKELLKDGAGPGKEKEV